MSEELLEIDKTVTKESLDMIIELLIQSKRHLDQDNISDYQKNIVLSKQGLEFLFEDLVKIVKQRS